MEHVDTKQLAALARIAVTDEEVTTLAADIEAVLAYVSDVNDITAENGVTKKVGPVHNILREDDVTNEPGAATERLLAEAPDRSGAWLKVRKILNQE